MFWIVVLIKIYLFKKFKLVQYDFVTFVEYFDLRITEVLNKLSHSFLSSFL